MNEWIESPLSQLVTFQKGRKVETSAFAKESYAEYLGASGIEGKSDGYATTQFAVIAKPTDTLMLWDGERSGLVGYGRQGVVASTVSKLSPNDKIDPQYLYFALSERFDWIQHRRTGTGVPHVPKDLGRILKLRYPKAIPVQKKIVAVLTAIDAAIDKTEALISKYQQIKAGLMHNLFTRGVLPNGKLRPPREQAPELYQETAVGWIPREWDFLTLGEIASFQRGHDIVEAQFKDGDFPVISSSGVIGFHSKSTTKSPNVVIGRKGTIGKVHFMEQDFWAHDTSLFTTNFFGNYEKFVFHLCIYLELAKFGTKSGSPSLNRNDIHPIRVGRPQRGEQMAITKLLDTTELHIDLNRIKLSKLKKQKLGLMQDLLTGKVPVRVDEPTLDAVDG